MENLLHDGDAGLPGGLRAEPIIQLAPPLVADLTLWDEMAEIVADALEHAAAAVP